MTISKDNITEINQIKNGLVITDAWYNSYTDCRSVYNDVYSTIIEHHFYVSEGDLFDRLYDVIDLNLNTCEYDLTHDYGIKILLKPNNISAGTYGTMAQLDPFDTDIEITNQVKFIKGFTDFINFTNTKPSGRSGNSNFNTYIEYKGYEFIYTEDASIGDLFDMYIKRISHYNNYNSNDPLVYYIEDAITITDDSHQEMVNICNEYGHNYN